jgi:hypothetical protein
VCIPLRSAIKAKGVPQGFLRHNILKRKNILDKSPSQEKGGAGVRIGYKRIERKGTRTLQCKKHNVFHAFNIQFPRALLKVTGFK